MPRSVPRLFAILAILCATAGCGDDPVGAGKALPPREAAMTAAAWQSELEAALPAGTPLADVRAWLAREGIEHGEPVATAAIAHMGQRGAEAAAAAPLRLDAIRRDVGGHPLSRASLAATFDFDERGQLRAIRVEEVRTGL